MIGLSNSFENICYLYVCKKKLFEKADADFFRNRYLQILFLITKQFYKRFSDLPFNLEDPSTEQIAEILNKEELKRELAKLDSSLSLEENKQNFLINVRVILETDMSKYRQDYLDETCVAWIHWENSQKGYRLAMDFQRTQQITPENVLAVIKKSKEIVLTKSSISIDDDIGEDLFDAKSHIQPRFEDLCHTNYPLLNKWVSEAENGGFQKGTLTVLVGAPNVGKSIWLGNIGTGLMLSGVNVLFISLEMATFDIHKRIGANLFDIPISSYRDFSSNIDNLSGKIKDFSEANNMNGIMPIGQFRTKRFSMASPEDIRIFALNVEEKLQMKFGAIIIDYLTEMSSDLGISVSEQSYHYHKQNTNALHKMGVDHNWAMITAHQIKIGDAGGEDLTLQSLSESSGILHKPDNIIGIIQSPTMKSDNKYFLKMLKGRNSAYKDYYIEFGIDYSKMRISERGVMIEPGKNFLI